MKPDKKIPKRNRLLFQLWRVLFITWGCFGVGIFTLFTLLKFSNLIFIFNYYGNIKFQNHWPGITINHVVIVAKCFLIWCLNIQYVVVLWFLFQHKRLSCLFSYLFINNQISSYLFSEKYLAFNLTPQAYGKKKTQM